ncbi:MAG: hypothetical protein ACKVP4_09635 [Hyphomicrobium sp.]
MSDRTQLAIGHASFSVPRVTKRLVEMAIGVGLTGGVALVILVLNNVLTGRGGWLNGFDVWMAFIRQPDILGTMLLTAFVTAMYIAWQRHQSNGKR